MRTRKTVFISSTFQDLKEHRRSVWNALTKFDVDVRGMENFGARTEQSLETCLAEVEQSDVYVGIVAYRLGSIDPERDEPFTLLEYRKAIQLGKEILIYIADDKVAVFPPSVMDDDERFRARLSSFKKTLRQQHTVETFSTPEDLADKLSRDFARHFDRKILAKSDEPAKEDPFERSADLLKEFLLVPKRYNGHQILLKISFHNTIFPASRALCEQFNLEYGFTVGSHMTIKRPSARISAFSYIYATGNRIDAFRKLPESNAAVDLYGQMQFSGNVIEHRPAEFVERSEIIDPSDFEPEYDLEYEPRIYIPRESTVLLLFTKLA